MPSRYVKSGGVMVELGGGGGGVASDQYPLPLNDTVNTATSRFLQFGLVSTSSLGDNTWTEIVSSLSEDSSGIQLNGGTTFLSANNTSTVLEIALGGSGSEVLWASTLIGYKDNNYRQKIPGAIPAGSRVSARIRSIQASKTAQITFTFLDAKSIALGSPVTMGDTNFLTAAQGITLTAPGSLNTKGAWTEIVASTSATFNALQVSMQGNGGNVMNGSGVLIDIGIGAASSEIVLIPDIALIGNTTEFYLEYQVNTFGVNIPAGSRITARYQRANSANTIDLALVGA